MKLTDFLNEFDFDYVVYDSGYLGFIDLQGANLGDIESDRYTNDRNGVIGMVDRLDIYYRDYIFEEMADDLDDNGVDVDYTSWRNIIATYKKNKDKCSYNHDWQSYLAEHIFNPELIELDSDEKEIQKDWMEVDEYV